jgi:hypothetical protein
LYLCTAPHPGCDMDKISNRIKREKEHNEQ